MKHADAATLDRLKPLLGRLRKLPLKEKTRGNFYRGSRAFLHFHEHGEELYVDIRLADEFERFSVTTAKEKAALMAKVNAALASLRDPASPRNRKPRAR